MRLSSALFIVMPPLDICECRNAGQFLSFEPFQKRAACGRNIGKAVGHAGQIEGCNSVAPAGDGKQFPFHRTVGHMPCRSDRAPVEGFCFKRAERSVPHQRIGILQTFCEIIDGGRTNVEDHFVRRDGIYRRYAMRGVRLEFLGNNHVGRQHDRDA